MQELVVYVAKSKKVMYSITFVILPVTKTIFCTRGCFSASLGLKMNIDSLSWPYGHLRLSNLSFPALVTLENNHSYQKLFPTLGKWQMNEVKYYTFTETNFPWECKKKSYYIKTSSSFVLLCKILKNWSVLWSKATRYCMTAFVNFNSGGYKN